MTMLSEDDIQFNVCALATQKSSVLLTVEHEQEGGGNNL
jgi:hypothetical protein